MIDIKTHPFEPQLSTKTKKLLIGTLPPEGASFYFSNSSNTRLWDILKAIAEPADTLDKGGYLYDKHTKIELLEKLQLGICDVVLSYRRINNNSTNDEDIQPLKYQKLLEIAFDNKIDELLFVYKNAYKWFLHSQKNTEPVTINKLANSSYSIGELSNVEFKGKKFKCVLLPPPLNRGSRGQTLEFKLNFYRNYIQNSKF